MGKICVTGGSSGIGRHIAIKLAQSGHNVIAVGRDGNRLSSIQEEAKDCLGTIKSLAWDLTQDSLAELFSELIADGDKLDGLVHSAGISGVVPLRSLTKKQLNAVMEINFYSFVELVRQYGKKKYSNGGSIVAISSLAAVMPRAYEMAYICSKAALNAAIPCLAIELVDRKIRVNGIMPGVVNTGMSQFISPEQKVFFNIMEKKTLGGIASQPEDIANVCAFLISEDSKCINGRVLYADDGMLL